MYQSSKKNDFDKLNDYLEQVQTKNSAEHMVNTKALMDIGVASIPRRDHVFANEVEEIRMLAKLHARQTIEATKATWARQSGFGSNVEPTVNRTSFSEPKQSADDLLREKVYREWMASKNAQNSSTNRRSEEAQQNIQPARQASPSTNNDEVTRELQKLEKMTSDFQKAVDQKIKIEDKNSSSEKEIERLKRELAALKNKEQQHEKNMYQQETINKQQIVQNRDFSEQADTSTVQHMALSIRTSFSDITSFARNMKMFADDLRRMFAKEQGGFKTYSEINNSVAFLQRHIFEFETLDREIQANFNDAKKSQQILDQMIAKENEARQTLNTIQNFLNDNSIFITSNGITRTNNVTNQQMPENQPAPQPAPNFVAQPQNDLAVQQVKQELANKQAELELVKKQAELELAKQQAELLKQKQAMQQQIKKDASVFASDGLKYNNTQNQKESSTMSNDTINKNNSTAMMLVTSFYQLVPPITSRFIATKNVIERLVKNDISGARMDGVSFVARSSTVLIRTLEDDLNRIDKEFFAFQDHVSNNVLITKEAIDNFRNIVLGLQSKLDNIIEIENVLNDAARETREISIKHHDRSMHQRENNYRYNDEYESFNNDRFMPTEKIERTKIVELDGDISFSRDISISKAKEQKALNEIINQVNFYIEDYKVLKAEIMNLHDEFQEYADNIVRNHEITQEIVDTEEKITQKFSHIEKMSHNFNLEVNNLTWKVENNSGEKISIDSLKTLDSTLFDLKEQFKSLNSDVRRAIDSQGNLRSRGHINTNFAQDMSLSDLKDTVNTSAIAQQRAAEQRAEEQRIAEQREAEQRAIAQQAAEQQAAEQKAAEQKAAEQAAQLKNEADEEEQEREAERLEVENKKNVLIEHQKLIKMLITGFEDHKNNFEFMQRQQAQDALFSLELSNLQQEINNDFSSSKIDISETERIFDFSSELDSFELKTRINKVTNIFEVLQKKLTLLDKKILLFEEMLSHEKLNKAHEQTKNIVLNDNVEGTGDKSVSSTSNKP